MKFKWNLHFYLSIKNFFIKSKVELIKFRCQSSSIMTIIWALKQHWTNKLICKLLNTVSLCLSRNIHKLTVVEIHIYHYYSKYIRHYFSTKYFLSSTHSFIVIIGAQSIHNMLDNMINIRYRRLHILICKKLFGIKQSKFVIFWSLLFFN